MDYTKVELSLEEYITGLVSRNAKPWKMSPTKGIEIGDTKYDWVRIKELIEEQKEKGRTYTKYNCMLDEAIWDFYINFRDVDDHRKQTYGIETVDSKLSWDRFEDLVEEGQFELTDERKAILDRIHAAFPIEHVMAPNSPIEGEPYENM
jgi:hypothetical protein